MQRPYYNNKKVSFAFITCVLSSFPTYSYWTPSDV